MKKIVCLLLALVLVMGLAACGGSKTEESAAPAASAVAEATQAPTEAPAASEDLKEELNSFTSEVIDPDLTCTITLGNWPADTAPAAELAVRFGLAALERGEDCRP